MILILVVLLLGSSICGESGVKDDKQTVMKAEEYYKVKIQKNGQRLIRFDLEDKKYIILDVISTGTFQTCVLNKTDHCVGQLQNHNKKEVSLHLKGKELISGVKIVNPSNRKIKLKLNYHFDEEKCHLLEYQTLHRKELSHSNCFQFEMKS